jgi:hypothetical protein
VSEVTEMTQLVESDYSERIKIESWRLHVLIEAGYPLPLAEKIAHSSVDLHQAVDLIGAGCMPELPKSSSSPLLTP